MSRRFILLTEWEAYASLQNCLEYIEKLSDSTFPKNQQYLALPYDYLLNSKSQLASKEMILGTHDMNSVDPGSFTETVAIQLLKDLQIQFVLLGRSLKRSLLRESFSSINNKIKAALAADLQPFLCIGEDSQDEEAKTSEIIKKQLEECLKDIPAESLQKISLVYETPAFLREKSEISAQDINQAYTLCRQLCKESRELGDNIPILCAFPDKAFLNEELVENTHCSGFYFKK